MKLNLAPQNKFLSVRMTDEQAEALVVALQGQLLRRKALIAQEASMAAWNDLAASIPAELDGKNIVCTFGICAN